MGMGWSQGRSVGGEGGTPPLSSDSLGWGGGKQSIPHTVSKRGSDAKRGFPGERGAQCGWDGPAG